MPEMLWAVLLTQIFGRKDYLACFRAICIECHEWFVKDSGSEDEPDEEAGLNFTAVLDHTTLSEVSDERFERFAAIPLRHALGYAGLRPLLLVDSLPGLERWKRVLDVEPTDDDWDTLARAIANVLDHQSEQSTDIRWLKLMAPIIAGRLMVPPDTVEELRMFPDYGDMRKVRPSIRALEITLRRNPPPQWIAQFWTELLEKTRCVDPSEDADRIFDETKIYPKTLYRTRQEVVGRFLENLSPKRADACLDTAFGLVLYALAIAEEIGFHRVQRRIIGRLGLRALVEANITLRYLVQTNSDELWRSYRVYGAGQAKLAFLKAQELESDLPPFIDEDALYAIANEDLWQEFLDIDVGHWSKSNLRQLSIECGAKAVYDKYYDWASAFAHGHWGAIRDTNFVTCHNPLHRLHRIPRLVHRVLNSVEVDAIELVNEMLGLLDHLYPSNTNFGELSLVDVAEQANVNSKGNETSTADEPP